MIMRTNRDWVALDVKGIYMQRVERQLFHQPMQKKTWYLIKDWAACQKALRDAALVENKDHLSTLMPAPIAFLEKTIHIEGHSDAMVGEALFQLAKIIIMPMEHFNNNQIFSQYFNQASTYQATHRYKSACYSFSDTENFHTAWEYLKRASDLGHLEAQSILSQFYDYEKNGDQDNQCRCAIL